LSILCHVVFTVMSFPLDLPAPAADTLPYSLSLGCTAPIGATHSFPTRRSSDLRAASSARHAGMSQAVTDTIVAVATAAGSGGVRSEEHTSELQSRENRVCRLLLEKKK